MPVRPASASSIATGRPDDFHAWRTRAKAHWYHALLLAAVVADAGARAAKLHALSRALGRHHDLTLLSRAIARHGDMLPETTTAMITAKAAERLARLEEEAVLAGLELFDERPRDWRLRVRLAVEPAGAAPAV